MAEPERAHENKIRAKSVPAAPPHTPIHRPGATRLDDLHDGVIQTLFGVGLALEAAAATAGEETLAVRLEAAVGNLARVVRDLREYSATHEVERLDSLELEQVIRALTRELASAGGVCLRLQAGSMGGASLGVRSYLLVAMTAALLAGLARRHGGGSGTISLRQGRRWLHLDITTEGTGARPAPGWPRDERVRLRAQAVRLGCRLLFADEAGPVAHATVRVPLTPAA